MKGISLVPPSMSKWMWGTWVPERPTSASNSIQAENLARSAVTLGIEEVFAVPTTSKPFEVTTGLVASIVGSQNRTERTVAAQVERFEVTRANSVVHLTLDLATETSGGNQRFTLQRAVLLRSTAEWAWLILSGKSAPPSRSRGRLMKSLEEVSA